MAGKLRVAGLVAAGAGYAVLAHWVTASPEHAAGGALLAVAPWLVVALVMAWRSSRPALGAVLCLLAAAALWLQRDALTRNFAWVYLLQHVGIFLSLGLGFGLTLRAGRQPLVTRLARLVHGTLDADALAYTRRVTWAWTAFFVAVAGVSAVLFVLAPLAAWSVFANLATPLLVAAMFVAEYLVRLRMLPRLRHNGVLESVRAWRAGAAAPPPGGQPEAMAGQEAGACREATVAAHVAGARR